ncbi:MAG TPA: YfhO family protein [Anaerolineae bacterium]|nr:YfhO family protein [Anaerolineae bacterium]
MNSRGSKTGWLPFAFVSLGALILFAPLLTGRVLFWGTPLLQFVPWREAAWETLLQGHLPLWNDSLGMGAPLLANYQTALLYPPNWLLGLTGIAWGQGLLAMLHLIWAGCGMALLARRLGSTLLGQTLAGMAYGLSCYLVARAGFLSINAAAAWLPWLVLCADRLTLAVAEERPRGERLRALLWLALAFTMQWLAGHAQTAWYSLILIGAWALFRGANRGGWRGLGRATLWMLAVGALAFVLAAVQLLPTLEYMLQSHRAETLDPEFALSYSFEPWRSLGWLMPDLFGNPATGDYWGYGNYWEDAVYIGLAPFLLALLAIMRGIAGRDERKATIRFLVIAIVLAFVLALGKNTQIFLWLFENVPTFNLFQAPARWNLITVFCLALLAGFGADAWRAPEGWALYWMRLGTAGAVAIAATAWTLGALAPDIQPTFTHAFWLAGIWFFIFGLFALLRPPDLTPLWIGLMGCIVLADLCLAHWGLNPFTSPDLYRGESVLAGEIPKEHRLYMPPDLEQELKFERTHRFDTFDPDIDWRLVREVGLPNTTLLDGLISANNFDPLLPDRYVVWMEALSDLPLDQQERLMSLMDVGWRAEVDASRPSGVVYQPVADPARARLIGGAIWVETPQDALDAVLAADFDPQRQVVLEGSGTEAFDDLVGGEIVRLEPIHPGAVEIEVRSIQDAWLILSDTWYPGWRASVDGIEADILRADYLFRAIRVPAGEHLVVFRYEPLSVRLGFALSVLGCLIVGGMAWAWRRD